MKKAIGALIILGLTFLFGCRKDDGTISPAVREYEVFMGKRIQLVSDTLNNGLVVTHYEMVAGDKMVFKALYIASQDDKIYDDEYSETFWFEVDSNLTEFIFENDELEDAKAYFIMSGAWVPNKPFEVRDGYIQGQRVSGDYWEVWVDTEAETANDYRIKISLNELFKIIF